MIGCENDSNAALAHLKEVSSLRHLSLDGTGITDDGLASLHGLSELETLSLKDTAVTDDGVDTLKYYLPNCTIER